MIRCVEDALAWVAKHPQARRDAGVREWETADAARVLAAEVKRLQELVGAEVAK
jgi:hypothetical protein